MRTLRTAVGAALVVALALGALGPRTASAQIYPAPNGYCLLALSSAFPPVGSTVELVVTAADNAGNPLPNLTGSAQIVEQPGTSATLTPSTFTTGTDGTATMQLYTGTTPGVVRVSSLCGDIEVATNLLIGTPPAPPPTGEGPGAGRGLTDIAAAATLTGLVALSLLYRRATHARR